ncbi:MAG: tRNA (guanosine(46)-N7)-methyltransferase TrmB [Draconibacterium sp.]|nr:MAG: tRNA (guanosine(46)-N7)-methyltransferase TrmB [Draconibacterium sp.]
MSKNKQAKFREMEGFQHVIQAPYKVLKNTDFHFKGKWASQFFHNNNPIVLELGCGKGEYTVQLAEKMPEKNYIGVDIKGARMHTGAKQALDAGLKNVAFIRTNIELINSFFDLEEVDEIWLTFPDPQMKKTRKRLTSSVFLERYRKLLKKNGIIHLKTDSNFQYTYTKALVEINGLEIINDTKDLYQHTIMGLPTIKTFYEKQWLARGKTIKLLSFRLKQGELLEPDIEIERDDYRSFGRSAKDIH